MVFIQNSWRLRSAYAAVACTLRWESARCRRAISVVGEEILWRLLFDACPERIVIDRQCSRSGLCAFQCQHVYAVLDQARGQNNCEGIPHWRKTLSLPYGGSGTIFENGAIRLEARLAASLQRKHDPRNGAGYHDPVDWRTFGAAGGYKRENRRASKRLVRGHLCQ